MIVCNITTKVQHSIHPEWLSWLKEVHIPAVLATGCFTSVIILRLMEVVDAEGPTYAVQYYSETAELYNYYMDNYYSDMRQQSFDKWSDQFISFRSVMAVVN